MTQVLGLDPGFAAVGWAVAELLPGGERLIALGVLRTKKTARKQNVLSAADAVVLACRNAEAIAAVARRGCANANANATSRRA